jgi:hypothetical protein
VQFAERWAEHVLSLVAEYQNGAHHDSAVILLVPERRVHAA